VCNTTEDMGQITNNRSMDALIFISCQTGDFSQDNTIANAFAGLTDANDNGMFNVVIAFDGFVYTQKQTEGMLLWKKSYANTWTDPNPNGFEVYWKGCGTTPSIGSSFKGLTPMINATKTAKAT